MKTRQYEAIKQSKGVRTMVQDHLMIEHPLTVLVNDEIFTLTMQTPGDEEALIRGLLFAEGIVKLKEGILHSQVLERSPEGLISKVNVTVPENLLDKSQINKRNLLSVASCGICGRTELQDFSQKEREENITEASNVSFEKLFEEMRQHQAAFDRSGGCHAAATFDVERNMLSVKEDIGRHNAVDKVVGELLNRGKLKSARYLLVSGRVSYEIITKCFTAGIPVLAAVSAPSSLSVDFAKELGIALYAFCREERWTRYA
jgi:FdhD protein